MASTSFRQSFSQIGGYFLAGVVTLFVANLLGSIAIAVAHSIAYLYHLGPPDPATEQILAAVLRQVSAFGPLTNWMVVLCGAALLSYRSKVRSLAYFLAYVAGSWLSVLPFTLLPQHPEMHAVVPQLGRFGITSVFALLGVALGMRLHARGERQADMAWATRTAQNPQILVDALSQFHVPNKIRFALFRVENEQERRLGHSADSVSNAAALDPCLCAEFLDWVALLRDESLVRRDSARLHPSLPHLTWWYLLRQETQDSALLLVAPKRALVADRRRSRYQHFAELARLSLQQQELVRGAQERARDGERRLVSYEIHDHLAQDLISGLIQLAAARTCLGNVSADAARTLDGVEATLRRALDDTRQMAWKLHQAAPGSASLRNRLESVIAEFREHHSGDTEFLAVGDEPTVSPALDAILVAGLREALSNVKKHAMARKVQITLSHMNGSVALDVCDSGRGVRKPPLRALIGHGGFGLHALRRRVERAGGCLIMEEGQVGGTTLSIQFPAGALHN